MLSFWKVMLKSPTFWPFFSTNLSQKHKINFLSSMKLVTVPQKLFPNPKSNFTMCEKNWQWLELVWQRYNFPIFQQIAQVYPLTNQRKSVVSRCRHCSEGERGWRWSEDCRRHLTTIKEPQLSPSPLSPRISNRGEWRHSRSTNVRLKDDEKPFWPRPRILF